jgi:hypothetical protein
MSRATAAPDPMAPASEPADRCFWLPSLKRTADRAEISGWQRLGQFLFLGVLVAAAPMVLVRNVRDGGSDFLEYYTAGRYVLEHGARQPDTILGYYWPSVDVAWAALAWMPLPLAAAVWYAISCGSWIGLLNATGRYLLADLDEAARRRVLLAVGLLVMPIAILHACLGAFHVLMLWGMVAGLGRASRGRPWSGGFLLGLAVWVKFLPLLGVGYLVLKRRWKPALVAVASALLVDAVLCVAAIGPQAAWQWHQQWWSRQASDASGRVLTSPTATAELRLRNQSPAAVLRRTLTRLPCDPRSDGHRIVLTDLSPAQLTVVYYVLAGLLGLGILGVCRRPAGKTSPGQWSTEIALVVLSTMWFSPVVWSYHNTAVVPALAVVIGREPRHRRAAWLTIALWLAAMALSGWPLARGLGAMLWTSLAFGVGLAWTAGPAAWPACGRGRSASAGAW